MENNPAEKAIIGKREAPYLWYQADMNVAEVFPLHLELELPEGLDERHALDVPDCSSQLSKQKQQLGPGVFQRTHILQIVALRKSTGAIKPS